MAEYFGREYTNIGTETDPVYQLIGGGSGGGASVTTDVTAPTNPLDGDLWFNEDTAELFVYTDSINAWIQTNGGGGGSGSSGGGASWSSGWFDDNGSGLQNGATYSFTHDLGTADLNITCYVADDANGTNAIVVSPHDAVSASNYGLQPQNITASGFDIVVGTQGIGTKAPFGVTQTAVGKFIKIVASSGGSGGTTFSLSDVQMFNFATNAGVTKGYIETADISTSYRGSLPVTFSSDVSIVELEYNSMVHFGSGMDSEDSIHGYIFIDWQNKKIKQSSIRLEGNNTDFSHWYESSAAESNGLIMFDSTEDPNTAHLEGIVINWDNREITGLPFYNKDAMENNDGSDVQYIFKNLTNTGGSTGGSSGGGGDGQIYAFRSPNITSEGSYTYNYPAEWTGGIPDEVFVTAVFPSVDKYDDAFFQLKTFNETSVTIYCQNTDSSSVNTYCNIMLVKNGTVGGGGDSGGSSTTTSGQLIAYGSFSNYTDISPDVLFNATISKYADQGNDDYLSTITITDVGPTGKVLVMAVGNYSGISGAGGQAGGIVTANGGGIAIRTVGRPRVTFTAISLPS